MSEMTVDRPFFEKHFLRKSLNNSPLTASRKQGFNAIFDVSSPG
jgi:hypothetical protein